MHIHKILDKWYLLYYNDKADFRSIIFQQAFDKGQKFLAPFLKTGPKSTRR